MARARTTRPADCPYVGKGGLKLRFALQHFALDVTGVVAADLGCHVGGFTDCLLQAGATRIYAVDTGYGTLAWRLRQDPRVVVQERSNALHWDAPEPLDLVVVDLGWTPQARALPTVARLLRPGGVALSLVKPQYEGAPAARGNREQGAGSRERGARGHVVAPEDLVPLLAALRAAVPAGLELLGEALCPVPGSGGNREAWWHLRRVADAGPGRADGEAC